MSDTVFLIFWICMAVILTASAVLFFFFCKKCGMFEDKERCRHLALWAHTPDVDVKKCSEIKSLNCHPEELSDKESFFNK